MYEGCRISRNPYLLSIAIAEELGWRKESTGYFVKPGVRPKKYQVSPSVRARPTSLTIQGLDWMVKWHMHDGHLDGVHVVGVPDSDVLDRVFSVIDEPGLQEGYAEHMMWITKNPEYWDSLPGSKSSKRPEPRGYLIA